MVWGRRFLVREGDTGLRGVNGVKEPNTDFKRDYTDLHGFVRFGG